MTVTKEMHISDTLLMFYLKRWRPEYRESFRAERRTISGDFSREDDQGKLDRAVEHFRAEVLRLSRPNASEP
jgi:hypothetical protein